MQARLRTRSAALLVVGLAHVGLLAFLVFPSFPRRGDATPELTMVLTYFDEPPSPPPVSPRNGQRQRRETNRLRTPAEAAPARLATPTQERAITPAPPIDWSDEARRASEATLARQDKDRALRSFDFPKGTGPLPPLRSEHIYGDIEHYEGGETIMWINSRCYYTNRPLADFAAHMGPGSPPMAASQEVCKHR